MAVGGASVRDRFVTPSRSAWSFATLINRSAMRKGGVRHRTVPGGRGRTRAGRPAVGTAMRSPPDLSFAACDLAGRGISHAAARCPPSARRQGRMLGGKDQTFMMQPARWPRRGTIPAEPAADMRSMERQSEKTEPYDSLKNPHSLPQTGAWKTNRVWAILVFVAISGLIVPGVTLQVAHCGSCREGRGQGRYQTEAGVVARAEDAVHLVRRVAYHVTRVGVAAGGRAAVAVAAAAPTPTAEGLRPGLSLN